MLSSRDKQQHDHSCYHQAMVLGRSQDYEFDPRCRQLSSLLRFGVPADKLAGHWCPQQIVDNIPADCGRRLKRLESPMMKPRRFLVPVEGAGAQKAFVVKFDEAVANTVKNGKLQLFLNAGDHAHMKKAFVEVLEKCKRCFDNSNNVLAVSSLFGERGAQG